jgi:hypothetical protein
MLGSFKNKHVSTEAKQEFGDLNQSLNYASNSGQTIT